MQPKGARQLYYKLFGIYTAMILIVVLVLLTFFIQTTKSRILTTNLEYLNQMQHEATSYLSECASITDTLNQELHQSQDELQDLLFYLGHDPESYQRFRLDSYMATASLQYRGFDDFAERNLKSYDNLINLYFYSYTQQELTICQPEGRITKIKQNDSYAQLIKKGDLITSDGFGFLKEIRDPKTMENTGFLIAMFAKTPLEVAASRLDQQELLIENEMGTEVFSSAETLQAEKENLNTFYSERDSVRGYTSYSFLDRTTAKQLPVSLFLTFLFLALVLAGIGMGLVGWYLKRLTKRLTCILDGMQRVTVGDLDTRLPVDEKGDELDVISSHFNEMCQQLDRYIQKSYLAEIEQKTAEMEVLQNQINPHFLYNTLESIRMKAICNKDRDVAKMLYSMSVIFRSQLKEDNVITLVQELHYCKKYLELFEYRYQGKFSFSLECPEEYMDVSIIKFIVQPILENYFAHGIQGEKEGNKIFVYVEMDHDELFIHVSDNGLGMSEEDMAQMNAKLIENADTSKSSIGLTNVNRRLKAVYGPNYGVTLKKSSLGGLHVILKAGGQA